tara:strand:- start:59 stop:307 length:249 start_codon:yes stop_codon:yes gene_type:complete
MWVLNLVRNNKGEEEVEVKDMSNKEKETKEEKNNVLNLENIRNLINEESNDTIEVNHYKRHWGKYVCGVVLLGGGYLFYRSR